MLLIVQIILTVFAFRNGWKWRALLPLGILLLVAFGIGWSIAVTGGSIETVHTHVFALDIAVILILAIMTMNSYQKLLGRGDEGE